MAIISFGKDKTYSWSYFKTQTYIAHMLESAPGAQDGRISIAKVTPTTSNDWTSLTGFTEESGSGTDTLIDPAGQLRQ